MLMWGLAVLVSGLGLAGVMIVSTRNQVKRLREKNRQEEADREFAYHARIENILLPIVKDFREGKMVGDKLEGFRNGLPEDCKVILDELLNREEWIESF